MNTSSELLIDEAGVAGPDARWLIVGGEADLVRASVQEGHEGDVVWMPYDAIELQRLGDESRVRVVHDPVNLPGPGLKFDVVLVPGVADRDLNRRSLIIAKESVRATGWVTIAGANNEGVKSFLNDAQEIFGVPFYSGYRSRHRVATFEGMELTDRRPDWSVEPGVEPGTWIDTGVFLAGQRVMHATTSGVFAAGTGTIDEGTRLLLEHFRVEDGQAVLDVGTGSGILGAYAARMGGQVTMTDVNLIAVQAANRTMGLNEFAGFDVVAGDTYDPLGGKRFDLIVSNPPFHRGRRVSHEMSDRLITGAPRFLTPEGSLLVVANAFLSYGKQMRSYFERVETVVSNRRYHVVRAQGPIEQ